MRSRIVAGTLTLLLPLALVGTGPALAAGTLSGATSHGSVTVTVQDAVFDGPDCVQVPVEVAQSRTASEADMIGMTVNVSASQAGSNSPATTSAYISSSDPAKSTVRESLYVCPSTFSDAAGPITVRGNLESRYYVNDSEQRVDLQPAATLTVVKNPTTLSSVKVAKAYSPTSRTISGKAIATTTTKGPIGASGEIQIAVKLPGSSRWVGGSSTYPDSFGNWTTTIDKAPKGTQVRMTLVKCGWCTDAQRIVKVTK